MSTQSKQSKGGVASAASLSQEQRKINAKKAIDTRWKKSKGEGYVPVLPEVKHKGIGELGGHEIECYVLSNGDRVLSYRQCVQLITGKDNSQVGDYIGVDSLKSLIDKDKVVGETVEFKIPKTNSIGKGIKAEIFADICKAFVEAAYLGLLKTERQKQIALKCAFLQSGFMKVGIIGFVDEITGYQNYRAKDDLQIKLNAYLAEQTRKWQKTFKDEYYQELARLGNVSDWRLKQPYYAQITRKVYKLVDPDVAQKLIDLDVNPNVHQHQYLSENFGVYELKSRVDQVIGLARGCSTLQEFNSKMKLFEPGGTYQMNFRF